MTTIDFTADALATLSLFDWTIIEQGATQAVISDDHSGWLLVTIASVNTAALTRDERDAAREGDLWEAHDDWCSLWHGQPTDTTDIK